MWFPSKKKVTRAIERLVVEYTALQKRISVWKTRLQALEYDFARDEETAKLAAWVERTEKVQANFLDALFSMGMDLSAGHVEWRHLLPVVEEGQRSGELTRRILDKLDLEMANSEARMRAIWRSRGLLDE